MSSFASWTVRKVALGALCCASISAGDWPVERGDPGLSGHAAGGIRPPLERAWSRQVGEGPATSVVLGSGRAVVGCGREIVALDAATGEVRWRSPLGEEVRATPLLDGDRVYVGSLNGSLFSLAAKDGRRVWQFQAGAKITGSANMVDLPDGKRGVVFGAYDSTLHCLDARTGEPVWNYETGSYINSAPAVAPDGTLVLGACDAHIHVIDSVNGKERFSVDIGSYVPGSPALSAGRAVVGQFEGRLVCLDLQSRKMLWRVEDAEARSPIQGSPACDGTRVAVVYQDGRVSLLDAVTGERLWTVATGGETESSPVLAGDLVVVAGPAGRVLLLNAKTGKRRWAYDLGQALAGSPAVVAGRLYVADESGWVHAFAPPNPRSSEEGRHE